MQQGLRDITVNLSELASKDIALSNYLKGFNDCLRVVLEEVERCKQAQIDGNI